MLKIGFKDQRKFQLANALRSTTFLFPMIVVIVSVLYYLTYHDRFIQLVDEGLAVSGALRVLEGQIPLIDFYSYTPGRYYLLAGFFKVFGVTIASERMMWIVIMTSRNFLAYVVASNLLSRSVSLVFALTLALIPGPWFKSFYTFFLFLHIAFLAFYLQRRSPRSAFLLGAISGGILYFRFQFSLMALAITAVVLVVDAWFDLSRTDLPDDRKQTVLAWRSQTRRITSAVSGFMIAVLPFGLFLMLNPHRGLALDRLTSIPVQAAQTFFDLSNTIPSKVDDHASSAVWTEKLGDVLRPWMLYFYILSLVLGLAAMLYTLRGLKKARRVSVQRGLIGLSLLIWSAGMFLRYYPLPLLRTFLFTGQATWLLTMWFITITINASKDSSIHEETAQVSVPMQVRSAWFAGSVLMSGLVVITLGSFLTYALLDCPDCGSWRARSQDAVTFESERAPLILDQTEAERLNRLIGSIQALSNPDDPIFAYRHSMLYFLAERHNATPLDNMIPPIFSRREANIVRASILLNPPKLQIYQITKIFPQQSLLFQYPCDLRTTLMDGYRYYDLIGNFLIMVREPGANGLEALRTAYQKRGMQFNLNAFSCE